MFLIFSFWQTHKSVWVAVRKYDKIWSWLLVIVLGVSFLLKQLWNFQRDSASFFCCKVRTIIITSWMKNVLFFFSKLVAHVWFEDNSVSCFAGAILSPLWWVLETLFILFPLVQFPWQWAGQSWVLPGQRAWRKELSGYSWTVLTWGARVHDSLVLNL